MSLPWAKQLLGQNETQRRNHTSAIHTHTQQAMWQRVMGSYAASFPTFLSPMLKLRPLLFFWWQKLPPHWPSSKQCLCDKIKLMFSPSSCWFSEKGFLPFCFSTCLLASLPPPFFLKRDGKGSQDSLLPPLPKMGKIFQMEKEWLWPSLDSSPTNRWRFRLISSWYLDLCSIPSDRACIFIHLSSTLSFFLHSSICQLC